MCRLNYKEYQTINKGKPTDILKQKLMVKMYNWGIKWTWFADNYVYGMENENVQKYTYSEVT